MSTKKETDRKNDGFIGQRMVYLPGIAKKKISTDPRISDLFITHIGIFPRAKGHLRKRPLGSSQFIMIYCIEGEGWIEVDNKHRVLSSNQLFIIPPFTPCSYGASDKNPWTNYWFHFTGSNALAYSPPVNQIIDLSPSRNSRIGDRLKVFEEILQNLQDYLIHEKVVYANILLKQFLTSVRHLDVFRSLREGPENDVLYEVISMMKNNLHRKIPVSELASCASCSSSNIYKLFKRNLNHSPQDYFIHLKMERARKYLAQSNMKIKEAGMKLGYHDPYYFSRIFKKHVGLSPANYRREEKNAD